MQTEPLHDIFISHSHVDNDAARDLADEWTRWGYGVDADFRDKALLKAARDQVMTPALADHLRRIILGCKVFVFLVSEKSAQSGWMPWELGLAHGAIGRVHLYLLQANALEAFDAQGREYLRLYEDYTFSVDNARVYLQQVVSKARFEAFSPAQIQATVDSMQQTTALLREGNLSELGRLSSVGSTQISAASTGVTMNQTVDLPPQLKTALEATRQLQDALQVAIRTTFGDSAVDPGKRR